MLPDSETADCVIKRNDIDLSSISKNEYGLFPLSNKPIRVGTVNKGGQGERIYSEDGVAITLSASGGGVGSKTGLYLINGKVRKLAIDSSPSQSYKQFGNSLVIDVVQKLLIEVNKVI